LHRFTVLGPARVKSSCLVFLRLIRLAYFCCRRPGGDAGNPLGVDNLAAVVVVGGVSQHAPSAFVEVIEG
jgi:hypothetical protein